MKPSLVATFFVLFLLSFSAFAQVRLPQIISDGLVLQREQNIKIWGWSSANEEISLNFKDNKYQTVADDAGNWEIMLPPRLAGGPYDLTLRGKNEIIVKDVLIGDVWLCAGQSNMVLPMERVKEKYPIEIASAQYPEIRNFIIATVSNPQDVMTFGAVSYFFAREIYDTYSVPIGLINTSVGGTPLEAWISEEGLKDFPGLLNIVQQNKDTAYVNNIVRQTLANQVKREEEDKGLLEAVKWFDPAYTPKGWKNIHIPGYWEDQGLKDLNGVVWYRKEIDVPVSMTGIPASLFMGRIVDADYVYVNGEEVGNITYQYPPRRYNVTNGQDIDLKGDWDYKVGDVFKPVVNQEEGISFQKQPSSLYKAMVAPIKNQAIKGFLWYQGESNTGNPDPYYELFPAPIKDWRNQWNDASLPFLYVQLANYMDREFLPVESKWAELRDAQLQTLSVPNTAMTVAIDLGEWNDIHPLNKKDIGYRLALGARQLAYEEKTLVYSGPVYESHVIRGNQIIINFKHIGSGLISIDDQALSQFAIAGADKNFEWAEASIVNRTVVVSNKNIPTPVYLRYAWSNNPDGANLYKGTSKNLMLI